MPHDENKILEFNQYLKSIKSPYLIYSGRESLNKKIGRCKNNRKNHPQQNLVNIFDVVTQCLLYTHLMI